MSRFWGVQLVFVFAAIGAIGCGDDDGGGSNIDGGNVGIDGSSTDADLTCNPAADTDGDGIINSLEGCATDVDTDGDGTPDWRDDDSDGDGVKDGDEDRNGDGMLGECTAVCMSQAECTAAGSTCAIAIGATAGVCVDFLCLDGESDPRGTDTDGDGTSDGAEGTWVCNPPTEVNPNGLKPFKKISSANEIANGEPDWLIAVEPDAITRPVGIMGAEPLDSAFVFDLSDPGIEVAGFLVSRPANVNDTSAVGIAQLASEGLTTLLGVQTSTLRASGTRGTSLDDYDTVLSTTVVIHVTGQTDVTAIRKEVIRVLSGRPASQITVPALGWMGANDTDFVVTFQTLFRTDTSQVVFMGAVTARVDYDDPTKTTGFHAEDLSNGTGLTRSDNGDTVECEAFLGDKVPKADIIWVMDESGSMSDDNMNVSTNSVAFFNQATTAGLDFRMGVTAMNLIVSGKFASRDASNSTGDRWLLPSELATFQTNIADPSSTDPNEGGAETGLTAVQNTILRHVPRSAANTAMVRPDAQLVILIITDEAPDEIEDAGFIPDGGGDADAATLSAIVSFIKPYIDLITINQGKVHVIGVPPPYPSCNSSGEVGWGYTELAAWFSGQFGSLCQPDLGATIQAIITDILGSASQIVLEWVPISATIAVTRNGEALPRSRTLGWDYNASNNAIVLHGIPLDPENPAEIVVSYRRWSEQPGID